MARSEWDSFLLELKDPTGIFEQLEYVGSGSFSDVYKARYVETDELAAVKKIQMPKDDAAKHEWIMLQVNVLQELSYHKNIVTFYGVFGETDCIWLVLDFCDGGSVSDLIEAVQTESFKESWIAYICREVLKGLAFLHENKVIHRDVTCKSVFLKANASVQLGGFHMCARLGTTIHDRHSAVGTYCWMAPEMITGEQLDATCLYRCDLWSLGITAIAMAEGRPPHHEMNPFGAMFAIATEPPPKLKQPEEWSPEFGSFLQMCLLKDPSKRPTSDELLNSYSFVMGFNEESVRIQLSDQIARCPKQKAEYFTEVEFIDEALEIPGTPTTSKKQEFLNNIEKHARESGSVLRQIGNLVFIGLPGSGKSTLIANLLNLTKIQDLINASPSTGVMDGIITVDIFDDKATLNVADIDSQCEWTQVEFSVSCLRQMGVKSFAKPTAFISGRNVSQPRNCQLKKNLEIETSYSDSPQLENTTSESLDSKKKHPTQSVMKQEVQNVLSIVNKLLNEKKFADILRFLQNRISLYLTDTGGQIEFQELLPLLISAQAIFVFIFSLVDGLDIKVSVSFREKVGEGIKHSNCYTSSITVKKSFLQTLSSIDSMQTFTNDFTSSKHKPYVFVVGTHRDELENKLGKGGAQEKIAELNKSLLLLVRQHKYDHLVVMADKSKNEVMFAVDNTRQKDSVFSQIRSCIKSFIESREEFNIEFPLSYLLASLELHESKDPFIDLEKFTQDVAKYGIQKADIQHLIHFLQSRIGLIRYFPIKELEHVIVRDPQVLYDIVTYLLIQSFLTETAVVSEQSEIKKGIYSEENLRSCFLKFNFPDLISPEMVILLLRELRIMASFFDHESEVNKFFIPCILNHLEASPKLAETSVVQTLAIQFKCGHSPKGLFGVLLHYLLTHTKSDESLDWVLDKALIFQDQVSFKVGFYRDLVTLKTLSSHLEVSCHPTSQPERDARFAIKVVSSKVLSTLLSGIDEAIASLHYDTEKTRHSLALVSNCPMNGCTGLHEITTIKGDHKLFVDCFEQMCSLPDAGKYWFGSVPVYSFPGLLERAQLKMTEGSEVEVLFELTSDPPLLEGKKHILFKEGVPVTDSRVSVRENAIHFANIRREDAGNYTITSSNGLGGGHGSFYLAVSSPPQYTLEDDYVKAIAGESPTLHFTVTSDSPLPDDTKHSIYSEEGKLIRRFKVSGNIVTCRDVEISDSGEYTICCRDSEGLEGKATFVLSIIYATSARTKRAWPPVEMKKLQLIKWTSPQGEEKRYRLIEQVSAKWRDFGSMLGVTQNTMEEWHQTVFGDVRQCWVKVMQAWLDGQGHDEYPLSWKGLFDLLEDVNCAGVVPQLEEALIGV